MSHASVYRPASEHSPHTRTTAQQNEAAASQGLGDIARERNIYSLIQQDPRYLRWLYKLCPKLFSKEKLKSLVDPAYIPFIGIGVNLYRARNVREHKHRHLRKFEGEMTDSKMERMDQSANEEEAVQAAKGTVSAALHFVPLGQLLGPLVNVLGGASNTVLTPLVKLGAAKAAQKGAKAGAGRTSEQQDIVEVDETIFESWQAARAFFIYLGYPETRDHLYQRWEEARIKIKTAFGARPQDDLFTMKPDSSLDEKLKHMEKERGEYDMSQLPNVSYLLLLWRAFDCWDLPYYDRFKKLTLKGRTFDWNDDHIRNKIREKEREKDLIFVKKTLHPDDSHIMLLESKLIEKDAVNLMVETYANTPRMKFLESTEKEIHEKEEEKREKMEEEHQAAKPTGVRKEHPIEITIRFVEAAHLVGANDPYITARFITNIDSDKDPKVKTRVVNDTTDPKWNSEKKLVFYNPDDVLEITVRDHDRFTKDAVIGKFSITMTELAYGVSVDKWYDLLPIDHGRVHLVLTKRKLSDAVRKQQIQKAEKQKRWLAKYLISNFSSEGETWIYFDETKEDGLLAVALFEPPNQKMDVHKSLAKSSAKGTANLKPRGYKDVCDLLGQEDEAKRRVCKTLNYKEKKVGVIHWLAYRDLNAARELVRSISNHPYPTLFLSYKDDMPVTHSSFISEFGFSETPLLPYKFQFLLHRPPEWYEEEGGKKDYELK